MEYIYGVDETAKCPVIGSMPICIVKVPKHFFKRGIPRRLPIKDSKLTTKNQRKLVYNSLRGKIKFTIQRVYPTEMVGANLIDLEVGKIITGLKKLGYKKGEQVYIDLFDATSNGLVSRFKTQGFNTNFERWVIEHDADTKYKVVSLASIFSKLYNDEEFERLRDKHDIGSGNPSDIQTVKFIIENYDNLPWFVRKSWITVKRLDDKTFREKILKKINNKLETDNDRTVKNLYDI